MVTHQFNKSFNNFWWHGFGGQVFGIGRRQTVWDIPCQWRHYLESHTRQKNRVWFRIYGFTPIQMLYARLSWTPQVFCRKSAADKNARPAVQAGNPYVRQALRFCLRQTFGNFFGMNPTTAARHPASLAILIKLGWSNFNCLFFLSEMHIIFRPENSRIPKISIEVNKTVNNVYKMRFCATRWHVIL